MAVWRPVLVFAALVVARIIRPWLADVTVFGTALFSKLTGTGIALLAVVALFVIPVEQHRRKFVLDWSDAREMPWGTLILFGGGLSLAATIHARGADQVIGLWVASMPPISPIVMMTLLFLAQAVFAHKKWPLLER